MKKEFYVCDACGKEFSSKHVRTFINNVPFREHNNSTIELIVRDGDDELDICQDCIVGVLKKTVKEQ